MQGLPDDTAVSVQRVVALAAIAALGEEITRCLSELVRALSQGDSAYTDFSVLADAERQLAQIEGALCMIGQPGLSALVKLVSEQLRQNHLIGSVHTGDNRSADVAIRVMRLRRILQRALKQCLLGKTPTTAELLHCWQPLLLADDDTPLHPAMLVSLDLDAGAFIKAPCLRRSDADAAADADQLLLNLLQAREDASLRDAAHRLSALFDQAAIVAGQSESYWQWQALKAYCIEYAVAGGDTGRIKKIMSVAVRLLRWQRVESTTTSSLIAIPAISEQSKLAASAAPQQPTRLSDELASVTQEALFELAQRPVMTEPARAVAGVFRLTQQFDLTDDRLLVDWSVEDVLADLASTADTQIATIESGAASINDPAIWIQLAETAASCQALQHMAATINQVAEQCSQQSLNTHHHHVLAAGLICLREGVSSEKLTDVMSLIRQTLLSIEGVSYLDQLGPIWRAHHTHDLMQALTSAIQADMSHVELLLDGEPPVDMRIASHTALGVLDRVTGAMHLLGLAHQHAQIAELAGELRQVTSGSASEATPEQFARQWAWLQTLMAQLAWQQVLDDYPDQMSAPADTQLDTIFLEEAHALIQAMRDGVASSDAAGLMQAAHTLAGCSATVGLSGLSALALALESFLEHQSLLGIEIDRLLINEVIGAADDLLQRFASAGERGEHQEWVQRLQSSTQTAPAHPYAYQEREINQEHQLHQAKRVQQDQQAHPTHRIENENHEYRAYQVEDENHEYRDQQVHPEQLDSPDQTLQPNQCERHEFLASQNQHCEPDLRDTPEYPVDRDAADPVDDVNEVGQANQVDEVKEVDEVSEIDELYEIFKLEAADLLPQIEEALLQWQQHPEDTSQATRLLRVLHTLKGSARMAGHIDLGDEFHQAETRVSTIQHAIPHSIVQTIIELRQQVDHWIYSLTNAGGTYLRHFSADDLNTGDGSTADPAANVRALYRNPVDHDCADHSAAEAVQRSPMLRVRTDRLAQFADTGAEIWSSNARLREGLQGQRRALIELADDLSRLRAQLRELEIEAESRVLARAHKEVSAEFDPLEFDRYTRLHELTRMMTESMTDVVGIQRGMLVQLEQLVTAAAEQQRDLRRQQAELQHLRSQPLHTAEPRLRHMLRQAAREAGCEVTLALHGGTIEIERDLLDRLLGPLEHLLRNAVVHGIESPQQRIASGKPELGCITLSAALTGNELQLVVQDDGRGLNLGRIHERAVATGLLAAGDVLQDHELTELIFTPGFSTASELTALSGRGIGLDAVRAELNALGGQIHLDSEAGRGCRFTLRLPLGLSNLQVVVAHAGRWRVGLPVSLVKQAMHIDVSGISTEGQQQYIDWQGQRLPLRHLARSLGDSGSAGASTTPCRVAVAVVSDGGKTIALQLDSMEGQRELIVKHPGPQLSRVPGLVGASVLADGAIALIIHPLRLPAAAPKVMQADTVPTAAALSVLVVDDSLTVRRATQRLLERHGYAVALARDGVEALAYLHRERPAVILLDIEMPRLDGFELLATLRDDARWRDLPVVMITSRIADRHRERALQLGANAYMGKPYHEEMLLTLLAEILPDQRSLKAVRGVDVETVSEPWIK